MASNLLYRDGLQPTRKKAISQNENRSLRRSSGTRLSWTASLICLATNSWVLSGRFAKNSKHAAHCRSELKRQDCLGFGFDPNPDRSLTWHKYKHIASAQALNFAGFPSCKTLVPANKQNMQCLHTKWTERMLYDVVICCGSMWPGRFRLIPVPPKQPWPKADCVSAFDCFSLDFTTYN